MAIERPHLGRLAAQQVVLIHLAPSITEMRPALNGALEEIGRVLKASAVMPAGPWFTHHHRRPTDTFDFDVCFPVRESVAPLGRVLVAELPEYEVARTAYHGPYEGLPHAWPEFLRWVDQQGYSVQGDFFEVYSRSPRDTPDSTAWQTDLMIPLAQGEAGKERLI